MVVITNYHVVDDYMSLCNFVQLELYSLDVNVVVVDDDVLVVFGSGGAKYY